MCGWWTTSIQDSLVPVKRVEDALRELAMHLSETIKHVSKGLVDDVCHYHLGAPRLEDDALTQTPSASCSDEVRTYAVNALGQCSQLHPCCDSGFECL